MAKRNNKTTVLDLFSGCGGLSHGFLASGYNIVAGIDNWDLSLQTFKNNHPGSKVFKADLAAMPPKEISKKVALLRSDIDVIVGGPPCQGFSISGKRIADDPRNKLYKAFVDNVAYFKPAAFIMENVPNLLSIAGGRFREEIVEDFQHLGYSVGFKILLASDYGVPQNRRRVFFVGLRSGKSFEFPIATHGAGLNQKVNVRDAISDLPEEGLPDGSPYPQLPQSDYQAQIRSGSDELFGHEPIIHSEKTRHIISMVPDGGNYKNLPAELQRTRKVNIAWTRFASNKPSLTIDTGHNHHFHYAYNRVPTAREAARLQSFPDTFHFSGKKNEQIKQIGNAVPPLLALAVARQLKKFL